MLILFPPQSSLPCHCHCCCYDCDHSLHTFLAVVLTYFQLCYILEITQKISVLHLATVLTKVWSLKLALLAHVISHTKAQSPSWRLQVMFVVLTRNYNNAHTRACQRVKLLAVTHSFSGVVLSGKGRTVPIFVVFIHLSGVNHKLLATSGTAERRASRVMLSTCKTKRTRTHDHRYAYKAGSLSHCTLSPDL